MKTVIVTIGLAILIFSGSAMAVENRYFYSSGKILPGEEWANVYVYNDSTVVDMNGGLVDSIGAFNTSTVNITDGLAYTIDAHDQSTINITGGHTYWPHAMDNSIITFSGNALAGNIIAFDSGKIIMTGGTTVYLGAGYSGTIDLYGGTVTESLYVGDLATINIYGHDFIYDPDGGASDGGQIRGFYLDNSEFVIDLNGEETYSHINFVPEPTSLLLFGLGALIVRRKK
jgi:hypothetical protein